MAHTPAQIATPYGTFADADCAGVLRHWTIDAGFVNSCTIQTVLNPKVFRSVATRLPRAMADASDNTPPAIATASRTSTPALKPNHEATAPIIFASAAPLPPVCSHSKKNGRPMRNVESSDQPKPEMPPTYVDQIRPPRSSGPVMRLEIFRERTSMTAANNVTAITTAQAKSVGSR